MVQTYIVAFVMESVDIVSSNSLWLAKALKKKESKIPPTPIMKLFVAKVYSWKLLTTIVTSSTIIYIGSFLGIPLFLTT